jgi:transcriptional regulator
MHLHPRFAWTDEAAMRAFVGAQSFAQISIAVDGRIECAHAPLSEGQDGSFQLHLARTNPLTPLLDGASVLATVTGPSAYISPDWYGSADQVPTWNYRLVEIRGTARRLSEPELRAQVDCLSAAQEARLLPKAPWTSGKMTPAHLDALVRAITGFAIEAPSLRGIAKLGQNKSAVERNGAITALRAIGQHQAADAMEQA